VLSLSRWSMSITLEMKICGWVSSVNVENNFV